MKELKHRFEELLEEHKITSNRLAHEIAKSPSTLSRIRSGESASTKHTIALISKYFGVNEKWLTSGIGEKYDTGDYSTNSNVRSNLVKAELINRLDVIHFKGNVFIKTPFNKFLLLVPVLGEMAQEDLLMNPDKQIPIDDYNRHPVSVSSPISGNFLAFEMTPDYSLNSLLSWDIIEKDALLVGREIKRDLWNGKFYFHSHRLYIFIHKTKGILVREVLSQPNDYKITLKTNVRGSDPIDEEIDLLDCVRVYSVLSLCHNM